MPMAWVGQMEQIVGGCHEQPIPVQADYAAGDGSFLAFRRGMGTEKIRSFIGEAELRWSL
ncbi:hypothetical protein J3A64_000535 [Pseudarthrobacter sp. PvP004]|nr:hypothetical protein [Pseudarthrobacter sp. PvP004]